MMRFADLDLSKTYSYADYFSWKFEERVELIKGKIFPMSPAPNRVHQELAGNIHTLLNVFLDGKSCKTYTAPFDVRIPRRSKSDEKIFTVLQPDVCVICDLAKLDFHGCIGAPDIVVEVLSPGNNAKELRKKKDVYEEAGVKEYWVVSPQDKWLKVYTLTENKFTESPFMVAGDVLHSSVLPGFHIDLGKMFEKIFPEGDTSEIKKKRKK